MTLKMSENYLSWICLIKFACGKSVIRKIYVEMSETIAISQDHCKSRITIEGQVMVIAFVWNCVIIIAVDEQFFFSLELLFKSRSMDNLLHIG